MKEEVGILEFGDVSLESGGCMVPIKLKLTDESISYKISKSGKHEEVLPQNLAVVNWQRLGGSYGIRIFTSNGELIRFGGFKENDQAKLEKFFKNSYNKTMTTKEFSVKGWNYGSTAFEGDVMSFTVGHLPAFEIPMTNVSNCLTGKNEATIEFHQNEEAPVSLMEMRLHIPTSELAGEDQVESFKEKVMRKASVLTITGDALAIFSQIQCLTPRGRYDFKVYPTFIQLHGKTFDFKIPVDTVLRLFLLPHIDGRQHFFVLSLDPPIKQGQTRYPYLIMLFNNDEMDEVELPLSQDEIDEKYSGRLEKEYSGSQYEVMSRLYKGLCQRKIVTPGSFIGYSGSPAVRCSYKAAAGYLYALERGFIYIPKPPIHVKFDEISAITFARSGSTTRSFDFEVVCKNSTHHTFSSIEKGEYGKLYEYCKSKHLPIKDSGGKMSSHHADDRDDRINDPYMSRVRDEAKERDDSEDEESEDEDFNPGEEASDIAEEFDSNASSSASGSDDSEPSTPVKPKKPVKEKKPEKKKSSKTVSEKPRKKKKEKDANKPKRPQSAYFIWLNEHREQIKKDNPGISVTEVSKKAGVLWKEVSDKTEWNEKAAEAKKDYEKAMKEYVASGGGSSSTKSSSPKKKNSKKPSTSPSKAGSGSGFQSKEYIDDTDSSDTDSDDKPLGKMKSPKKSSNSKKYSSEEEMDVDSD